MVWAPNPPVDMRNVFLVSKKQATGVFSDKTACHFGSVSLFPNQITSSSLREMSEFYILKKLLFYIGV